MKSIAFILFALLLFTGSACTKVSVSVRQHASISSNELTGTNCKLQRELRNQHQETNVWCWAASAHTVIEYLKNEPIKQCALVQAHYRSGLKYDWEDWLRKNRPTGLDPSDWEDWLRKNPPAGLELSDWENWLRKNRPTGLDPSDWENWLRKHTPAGLYTPNCCMKMPEDDPNPSTKNVEIAQNICYQNGWPEFIFDKEEFHTTFDRVRYDWWTPYPHGLTWAEIVEEICADRPMIDVILYARELGGGGHAVVIGGYSELDDGSQWVHVYDPGYNTEEEDSYIWPYDVYLGDPGVFTHVTDYKNISVQ